MVRRQVVALEIVGSSPIAHPSAPVAQRNRALVFGTRGRRFESYRACHRIQSPKRASYVIKKDPEKPKNHCSLLGSQNTACSHYDDQMHAGFVKHLAR